MPRHGHLSPSSSPNLIHDDEPLPRVDFGEDGGAISISDSSFSSPGHLTPIQSAESFTLAIIRIVREIATTGTDPCKVFANLHRLHEQLLVLSHVYSYLLQGKASCTQRDVYYHLSRFFPDQLAVNRVLQQVGTLLGCARHEMNVLAGCRGYVGGCVVLDGVDASTLGQQGIAIDGRLAVVCAASRDPSDSVSLDERGAEGKLFGDGGPSTLKKKERVAAVMYTPKVCLGPTRAIILVEKDAVFQRLMAERIYDYFPCIVITGMGFPPVAVQALSRYLVDVASARTNLPPIRVVGLVDYNPSGLHILMQYLNGSKRFVGGSDYGIAELKWLGVRSADVCLVHPASVHSFSDRDKSMLKRLISNTSVSNNMPQAWFREVQQMASMQVKVDIEALYTVQDEMIGRSNSFSRMIAQRIMQNDFI